MTKTRTGDPLAFIERAVTHEGQGCLIWPYNRTDNGYGLVSYSRPDGRRTTTTAHRLVLSRTAGPPPSRRHQAAHEPKVCRNPACVNPAHLRWATPAENTADQIVDGTRPHNYLTPEQVSDVRASPDSRAVLAARYGVSVNAIRAAQLGKTHRTTALERTR